MASSAELDALRQARRTDRKSFPSPTMYEVEAQTGCGLPGSSTENHSFVESVPSRGGGGSGGARCDRMTFIIGMAWLGGSRGGGLARRLWLTGSERGCQLSGWRGWGVLGEGGWQDDSG